MILLFHIHIQRIIHESTTVYSMFIVRHRLFKVPLHDIIIMISTQNRIFNSKEPVQLEGQYRCGLISICYCYRCANCFDCPSCNHSLSTRATTVGVPDPEQGGKTTSKKVYYLACSFCRWTSRDVGIKDQPIGML